MTDSPYRVPLEDLAGVPLDQTVSAQPESVVPHDLPGLPLPFGDGASPDDGD